MLISVELTAIRLEWVHARASRDRFLEEIILLRAESERVVKTFRFQEKKWVADADNWWHKNERLRRDMGDETGSRITEAKQRQAENVRVCAGREAFARRQAEIYKRLAVGAETRFEAVRTNAIKKNVWHLLN